MAVITVLLLILQLGILKFRIISQARQSLGGRESLACETSIIFYIAIAFITVVGSERCGYRDVQSSNQAQVEM